MVRAFGLTRRRLEKSFAKMLRRSLGLGPRAERRPVDAARTGEVRKSEASGQAEEEFRDDERLPSSPSSRRFRQAIRTIR